MGDIMAESEYKFVPIAENLEEQPSVIVNGKAYKEDKELNDFLNDNGLNVDTDALKFDIYNNINLKKFDINESRVLVEINDFTQYINQEEIVPGSLHTMLTLVSKEQKQRKLNIADFGFVDLQSLVAEANLNIVEKNSHPLKPGEYIAFVKVVWKTKIKNEVASVIVPLGADVKKSFSVGLKETELYFYAAKRQIKSKVIYSFDEHYQTLKITSEEMLDFNPSKLFGDLKNKTANPGKLYKGFQKYIYPMIYSIIKVMPVKKNRIFFASDSRAEMGGNFEFLNYELMNQGFDDVHYVFNENQFVKKSLRTFLKFAWLTATSEYIFIEESHPMLEHVSIKHKVNVIQTWHAAGAFKTFGYTSMRLMAQDTSKMNFHRYYTNATVSSEAMVPIYSEAFDVDSDIIKPLGLARSDLFWNDMLQYERINNLKQEYDFLNTGKKVILFAPTFRGAGRKQAHYPFEYLDLKAIYEAFKDDYIFLIKVHFNTLNKINIPVIYSDFFYDVSEYRDINDLMLLSDIMITDYSSVSFEFALLNKPMLFFVPDLQDYVSTRGFYYHYDELVPGKIVDNSQELIQAIENKDFEEEKIPKFKDHFFTYQDGKSSKRIIDYFINKVDEDGNALDVEKN